MGVLHYGAGHRIDIDDDLLAHLKLVVVTKLRRNESFTLSWTHSGAQTPGRSTIWLHPAIPLRFEFDSPAPAKMNPELLDQMTHSTHSTGGITVNLDQTFPD